MNKAITEPLEAEEQRQLFKWVKLQSRKYPELHYLYHVPNGGRRRTREAALLKAEGVKSGVPDIVFPCARGGLPWTVYRTQAPAERKLEQRPDGLSGLPAKSGLYSGHVPRMATGCTSYHVVLEAKEGRKLICTRKTEGL